jgi:hypothetical protein
MKGCDFIKKLEKIIMKFEVSMKEKYQIHILIPD